MFAVSLLGLGALSLGSGDFALNWQPVPAWIPWREALAYGSGLVMFAGGLGLLLKRTAARASLVVAIYLLPGSAPPGPARAGESTSEGMWLGVGENLVLLAGGWVLLATLADDDAR